MLAEPAPKSICILRLSALGDVCHALPVVRTLQARWPHCLITWIIGKPERALIGDIPGIEFILFDKSMGWRAFAALRKSMAGRRFDVLLHMQTSARANLAALLVPARIKMGYDAARSREGHSWVVNRQIAPSAGGHQIDDMFGFAEALGVQERVLAWDIPVPSKARDFAEVELPGNQRTLAINVCSSPSGRVHRDWLPERYAAVVAYAVTKHRMRVVLCGGASEREREAGRRIAGLVNVPVINLVGETSLKQLLAILRKATVLVTSDSGPAHMATAVGTPVIGLYAATNPYQTGPYLSLDWVVNHYPQAARKEYGKPIDQLAWGVRVHDPMAMADISADEVCVQLDKFIGQCSRYP